MSDQSILKTAIGDNSEVPEDWMPASEVRAFVFLDPIIVWLEFHGEKHGFQKDSSPYDFSDFVFKKGRQFEDKWISEIAPEAVRVCGNPEEVNNPEKMRQTWKLMKEQTPVISQAALWWAPERIYGVPDLIVHSNWLLNKFSDFIESNVESQNASNFAWDEGHYRVIDIKFTEDLTSYKKNTELENYQSQIRIYTYILGNLQGFMPSKAYIVQRKPVDELLSVEITSTLNKPLEKDLSCIRDKYVDIKLHGEFWKPWNIPEFQPNLSNKKDEQWRSAKKEIAENYVPGRDTGLLYQIGRKQKQELREMGYPSLDSLLSVEPKQIDFEKCKGLGEETSLRIRRILEANSTGEIVPSYLTKIQERKKYEFFVDFEIFNDLNVDFDQQWPELEGCEMIFIIGVGWESEEGEWKFKDFVASSESQAAEKNIIDEFISFLNSKTSENLNKSKVFLYNWSNAEDWQLEKAADRHNKPSEHIWQKLPWFDLEREVFLAEPIGIPGALNFRLKEISEALNDYDEDFNLDWPKDLDKGLRAMVMGWKAYQQPNPIDSEEMQTLIKYNEIDCKALWKILNLLRNL